jgi:hypothetical protein
VNNLAINSDASKICGALCELHWPGVLVKRRQRPSFDVVVCGVFDTFLHIVNFKSVSVGFIAKTLQYNMMVYDRTIQDNWRA